jgi:hypothetical protein
VSALVGLDGFVVCAQLLDESTGEWWPAVETTEDRAWCPACGVRAVGHGRRRVLVRDLPLACAAAPHGNIDGSHQYDPANHASARRAGILGVLLEPTTVVANAWELVAALEGNHGEVRWNPETHLPEGPVTLL